MGGYWEDRREEIGKGRWEKIEEERRV